MSAWTFSWELATFVCRWALTLAAGLGWVDFPVIVGPPAAAKVLEQRMARPKGEVSRMKEALAEKPGSGGC